MTSESRHPKPERHGPIETWPDAEYDVVLHLLDRQITDVDGLRVGKVDDVELTVDTDGALVPTGLLVGAAAWLPRFGGRLGPWLLARYVQMQTVHAERSRPRVVEMDMVDDVTSEVHLSVGRDGLLHHRVEPAVEGVPLTRHRLNELLLMRVEVPPEAGIGRTVRVLDARMAMMADRPGHQCVRHLLVGPGRPGGFLGYERSGERGPWVVATVVRWLHRHARVVRLGRDVELDWEAGVIRVGPEADLHPLGG